MNSGNIKLNLNIYNLLINQLIESVANEWLTGRASGIRYSLHLNSLISKQMRLQVMSKQWMSPKGMTKNWFKSFKTILV